MNRKKIIDAIEKRATDTTPSLVLRDALKFLSDTNLLALAISLGIDTDEILTEERL